MPEPKPSLELWSVHRQDDNGNRFVVRMGLGHEEASRLAAELESRAHKQLYWVERQDPSDADEAHR